MKVGDLVRMKHMPGWKRDIDWFRLGRSAIILEHDPGGIKVMLNDGKVLCDLAANWEVISENR